MTLLEKTLQTVGEARLTVGVNDDDIQAGYNSTSPVMNAAGGFVSYPVGANKGYYRLFASNNAGNTPITETFASHAQTSAYITNDPANANAVRVIGAGLTPFVSGNVPVATAVQGVFADSGVPASGLTVGAAVQVSLNATQVTGAYAAPIALVAAPGAGKTIIVLTEQSSIQSTGQTPFAGGGVGIIQYGNTVHGAGTNALSATIPSADITAATSQIYCQLGAASVATTVLTGITNQGLYFSNQTGPFTGGTGSTLNISLQYAVVNATV